MATPLVSVVLATYNMGAHLPEAVRSVQGQTYPHWEMNIVDDGSTDGTEKIAAAFLSDPRLRYHRQPNGGQAKAKNVGIRESTGDYVTFIDADDIWLPEKLERQLAGFGGAPGEVGVVYTDVALIDEQGRRLPTPKLNYHSGRISGRLLVDNFVTGMASMVRRECFERVGLFDESLPMGIDYDLWLRISAYFEFLYLDAVTYLYRQWSGQMSHNYQKRMECALIIMNRFLEEHPRLVDADTVREAWAHTYVGWGNACAKSGARGAALGKYLTALRHRTSYLPAWKGLARLAASAAGRMPEGGP